MSNYNFTLNMIPNTGTPVVVNLSQGDIGRELTFKLVEGSDPNVSVATDATAITIEGLKPSGLGFTSPYNGMTLCCEKFENENGNPSLWPSGAVKPARTLGTATEDCWTVVVIRPNAKKVNFIRFGAGNDYEISY